MNPINNKILIKGIEDKKSSIILPGKDSDPNKVVIKQYVIEKLGAGCNEELKEGQVIAMREPCYKINVTKESDKPKETGIWYFLIDESEVWATEEA